MHTQHVLTIVSMRIVNYIKSHGELSHLHRGYELEMKDYEQEDSKNNMKIDSSWDDPEDSRLETERAVNSVS